VRFAMRERVSLPAQGESRCDDGLAPRAAAGARYRTSTPAAPPRNLTPQHPGSRACQGPCEIGYAITLMTTRRFFRAPSFVLLGRDRLSLS